jgi:hypothetical protein
MSLSFQTDRQQGATPSDSVRYSEEMQQRIIVLAAQLQYQHTGTVSPAELEIIAGAVGLEPAFGLPP